MHLVGFIIRILVIVNCTFRQVHAVTADEMHNCKNVIFILSRTYHIKEFLICRTASVV